MKIDPKNLPSDPTLLHQMMQGLLTENTKVAKERDEVITERDEVITERDKLLSENISLKEQLALLKQQRFGKSSEKLDRQIEELELRVEEGEVDAVDTIKTDTTEKHAPKRQPLPKDLPREDVVLSPDPVCPSCGGESFRKISDDTSETLEYIPASFKVIRYVRPRCACRACDEIVQAYPPSIPIAKGIAEPGLLSHILLQKYAYHLPFYRQSEMMGEQNIDLSRSTMAGWAGKCAQLLTPLADRIRTAIMKSDHIHGDDTTVKVLSPGLGKTKTGRVWVYVRDGRPHGDTTPPAACYYYSPDRKGTRPEEHLKDFKGTFHADAYPGYDRLYKDGDITEAACWAHTRRKFYDVTVASDNAMIATGVLEKMAPIYKIEADIKGMLPDKRLLYRQEHSQPLVEALFNWIKISQKKLPRKSATAKAIQYALNNQDALLRFLTDGKVEIDNNAAERAMRSIAIGRKNWMFAGSDSGGDTLAVMQTIIQTAKLNGIKPYAYLNNVLKLLPDYNSQKLDELLPWNLKPD